MQTIKSKYNPTKTKIYANCPFCVDVGKDPDDKYHLVVVPKRFAFCYRCGAKMSYAKFASMYKLSVNTDDFVELEKPVTATKTEVDKFVDNNTTEVTDSIYCRGALAYLKKRNIDDGLIKIMNVKVGSEYFFGRVVFYDVANSYYVARSFLPGMENPKTLNTSGVDKPLFYMRSKYYTTLYLVEGTFDAVPFFKAGLDVACILGKDLSSNQLKMLKSARIDNLVVCLDADAQRDSFKLVERLSSELMFVNIGVVIYNSLRDSRKDPGEFYLDLFKSSSVSYYKVFDDSKRFDFYHDGIKGLSNQSN